MHCEAEKSVVSLKSRWVSPDWCILLPQQSGQAGQDLKDTKVKNSPMLQVDSEIKRQTKEQSTYPSEGRGSLKHGLFWHDVHQSLGGVRELRHQHRSGNTGKHKGQRYFKLFFHMTLTLTCFCFGDKSLLKSNRFMTRLRRYPTAAWDSGESTTSSVVIYRKKEVQHLQTHFKGSLQHSTHHRSISNVMYCFYCVCV